MRKYIKWDLPANEIFADGPAGMSAWEHAEAIGCVAAAGALGMRPKSIDNLIRSRRDERPARRSGFKCQRWNALATLTVADALDGELLWEWAVRVGVPYASVRLGVRERVVLRALDYRDTHKRRCVAWDGPARAYFADAPADVSVREYASTRDRDAVASALGVIPLTVQFAVERRANGEVKQLRSGTEMLDVTCAHCGMPFQVPAHRRKHKASSRYFCGQTCSGIYHRETADVRSERDEWVRFLGGYQWVQACLKRDEYTCQLCATHPTAREMGLAVHHRLPFAKYKSFRSSPENGVTLCLKCHRYLHSNAGELVRYRLEQEYRALVARELAGGDMGSGVKT